MSDQVQSNLPRYTSYPTADRFETTFGYRDYLQAVATLRTRGSAKPLALYLQIPFCDSVGYCAGDRVVGINRDQAAVYLSYLKREIEMQGRLLSGMNQVEQLHLGGGTPTCLSDPQMEELMLHLRRWFQFAPDAVGEYSIEIDPRTVSCDRVRSLRRQGFNRISIAVQEHDAGAAIIDAARQAQFRSVSVELRFGLPLPDTESMAAMLSQVIKANPDRIALYCQAGLPGAAARLAIEPLTAAGYVHIGMDHFAKAGDDLAIAQVQGRLHCNFQGYSAHADMDLVACGVSAISSVATTYSQNVKTLDAYYDLLDRNELPIERGVRLNMDDALRRTIIHMLMCQFELSLPAIEQAYPIGFADYFAAELKQLALLEADGLVTLDAEWLTVTPKGRVGVGSVCRVFDRYLNEAPPAARELQTI